MTVVGWERSESAFSDLLKRLWARSVWILVDSFNLTATRSRSAEVRADWSPDRILAVWSKESDLAFGVTTQRSFYSSENHAWARNSQTIWRCRSVHSNSFQQTTRRSRWEWLKSHHAGSQHWRRREFQPVTAAEERKSAQTIYEFAASGFGSPAPSSKRTWPSIARNGSNRKTLQFSGSESLQPCPWPLQSRSKSIPGGIHTGSLERYTNQLKTLLIDRKGLAAEKDAHHAVASVRIAFDVVSKNRYQLLKALDMIWRCRRSYISKIHTDS